MRKLDIIILFAFWGLSLKAQSWSPLGSGVSGSDHSVFCLQNDTINNLLYVGGNFNSVDGIPANNIAKWNGIAWDTLGSGTQWVNGGSVYSMTMYNGHLIAAGNFVTAGGIPAVGIAKWDGTTWSNLGMGIDINSNLNLKVTYSKYLQP